MGMGFPIPMGMGIDSSLGMRMGRNEKDRGWECD